VQAQLIEDLLDISAVISGELTVEFKPVDLQRVIAGAVESLEPAVTAKGIAFAATVGDVSEGLYGDAGRLQQIVWNLLSNAVKFTPANGEIRLTAERHTNRMQIAVTDNGIGIEPHFLPYVFERFRQADGGPTRRHGGLGLGLSICKDLVELHGWTLVAESDGTGRGATFGVTLPMREAPSRPRDSAPSKDAGRPIDTLDESAVLRGVTVLIVEDEDDAREMIGEFLKDCGANIFEAATCAAAFALFKRERSDVLLADIGLPDKDGYELIGDIRKLSTQEAASFRQRR
jgi:CheY-like chemotaxis protein